jgi:hypothetical protein
MKTAKGEPDAAPGGSGPLRSSGEMGCFQSESPVTTRNPVQATGVRLQILRHDLCSVSTCSESGGRASASGSRFSIQRSREIQSDRVATHGHPAGAIRARLTPCAPSVSPKQRSSAPPVILGDVLFAWAAIALAGPSPRNARHRREEHD